MTALAALVLAWCLHFAPPERQPDFPGFEESIAETTERYGEIARDVAALVEERRGDRSTAALVVAWAIGESALARDADTGPNCYHGPGFERRCDARGGVDRAASLFQIHAHRDPSGEQITVPMLFADRRLAIRIALRGLAGSWVMCRHLDPEDRLSGFGLGHCVAGSEAVHARFKLWHRVAAWAPPKERT